MNSEYITEAIMERQSSVSREDLGRREREDFKLLLFVHKTNLIVQADIRTLPIETSYQGLSVGSVVFGKRRTFSSLNRPMVDGFPM